MTSPPPWRSTAGVFSGLYKTAVSASENTIRPSPLQGIQHQESSVFVGQCLRDKNGEEQLETTWLLRAEVESAAEDWGATRVHSSTFYSSE
ncbi:avidin-like [Protobothrops mucrosquamatus]|uniref:avidin-like n=1 Tax=Protobothrops mucrosquamatus TaxID=103944 RepID=UPI0007759571|nr:avidin-like [Protobothrops mucrosquamatus]